MKILVIQWTKRITKEELFVHHLFMSEIVVRAVQFICNWVVLYETESCS
jgi:hypothetical protein